MRVVIVEPHRVYRDPLVQAVTAAGDVVLAADGDGRLALGLIRRLHPDVALLGALMPGANGTDIVAALARDGPDVPVVLLADFRDESLLHAALEAGAAAYITKDTDRAQIVRALHAAADPTRAPRHLAGGSGAGRTGWVDRQSRPDTWVTSAPTVAIIRLALVAAVAMGAVIDDRPAQYSPVFFVALAIAAVAAGIGLVVPARRRRTLYAQAAADLVLLATLAHASGGASSEVRFAFFAIPVLAAMLFRPRATLIVSAAVMTTYLTLALTQSASGPGESQQLVYVELVYLGWTVVAAVLLSRVLTRRADTIAELARARSRLMADVLDAEDRERRRLAGWLHDGAVQNLLVAGQDLGEAELGDRSALQRARTIVRELIPQLRSALIDLHPGLLTTAGLAPALRALAEAQARNGSFKVVVSVDEAAEGLHDALILSLARELLVNVVKHAQATEVGVMVRRRPLGIALEVADNGRGFELRRRSEAVADGHIGLASSTERVESLGGSLTIESVQGSGTRVVAFVPGT